MMLQTVHWCCKLLISSENYSPMLFTVNGCCSLFTDAMIWGRRRNTSVETGNFLQKNVKCMLVEFCRSVTPSPHVRVKGTWVTTASCCYTTLGNVFLLNGGSSHQPSAKVWISSGCRLLVRLPREFDNLLLNAAGYFDVLPRPLVLWCCELLSLSWAGLTSPQPYNPPCPLPSPGALSGHGR